MTDSLSSIDDIYWSRTKKYEKELADFLANNFSADPPTLPNLLDSFPYLERLGRLVSSFLRSLVDKGITQDMYQTLDTAIRFLIHETTKNTTTTIQSQVSLDNIRSLTSLSTDALSPPGSPKHESSRDYQALLDDNNRYKQHQIDMENEMRNLSEEIDNLYKEKDKKNSEIKENKIKYDEALCNKLLEIENLNDKITDLSDKVKFARDKEKKLNELINDANKENSELSQKFFNVKTKSLKRKVKINQLETDIEQMRCATEDIQLKVAAIEAESELKTDKNNLSRNQKTNEAIEKMASMLKQKEVDNLVLANNKKKAVILYYQLLSVIDEYDDRLSMAYEDNKVNLQQISELSDKMNKLTSENHENQETINSFRGEILKYKEKIDNFEKETGLSTEDPQKTKLIISENLERSLKEQKSDSQELKECHKVIDSLSRYITNLVNGDAEDTLPLLCRSEPILTDEHMRQVVVTNIEEMKAVIHLDDDLNTDCNNLINDKLSIFDKIFSNNTMINQVIDDYISHGKYAEYAVIVALCAANSNIRLMMETTVQKLTDLHGLLPNDYRNADLIESIKAYLDDSHIIYHQIFDAIQNSRHFHSEQIKLQPLVTEFMEEVTGLIKNIDSELRPIVRNVRNYIDIPKAIADKYNDHVEESAHAIEAVRRRGINLNADDDDDTDNANDGNTYNDQNNNDEEQVISLADFEYYKQQFEEQINSKEAEVENLKQEIEKLVIQLEDEQNDRKEMTVNLESLQVRHDVVVSNSRTLKVERDNYKNLAEKRKKRCARRIQNQLENEREITKNQIERLQKRFEMEKKALLEDAELCRKKARESSQMVKEMAKKLGVELEKRKNRINKLTEEKEEIVNMYTKQIEEKDSLHKQEIDQINAKLAAIEESIQIPIQLQIQQLAQQQQQQVSIMAQLTPSKNQLTPSSMTTTSAATTPISPRTPDGGDRFVAQIGRVLSKYSNDGSSWTRSKILLSLSMIVDQLLDYESKFLNKNCPNSNMNNNLNNNMNNSINDNMNNNINDSINDNRINNNMNNISNNMNDSCNSGARRSGCVGNSLIETPKSTPQKFSTLNKEMKNWQRWAIEIGIKSRLPTSSMDELRTAIKDIVFATTAKCHLVRTIQSLRTQKKLLLMSTKTETQGRKQAIRIRPVYLCVCCAMYLCRFANPNSNEKKENQKTLQ